MASASSGMSAAMTLPVNLRMVAYVEDDVLHFSPKITLPETNIAHENPHLSW